MSTPSRKHAVGTAILLSVVALILGGCAGRSRGADGASSGRKATLAPTANLTAAPTVSSSSATAHPTRASTTESSARARTRAPTSTAASAATTAPTPTTSTYKPPTDQPRCATSALTFGAQRGSGAMQQQYATISVVNHGGPACWLVGYAGVVLVADGAPLGHPAAPAGASAAVYLIAGHLATASLHGPSTCNAGVSDHVRVSAPGSTTHTDIALPMRACALIIGAFTA